MLAVEPSAVMRTQRPAAAAPCIDAVAEALPFADGSFDAAMAILSDHHWSDPFAGLREMRRMAHRVVVFQWDNEQFDRFWLIRDYLPEFGRLGRRRPTLSFRAEAIGATVEAVPIPWDCIDGFFHAHWRRPEAYLDVRVRRGSSVWAQVGPDVEAHTVGRLADDLRSGEWLARNRDVVALDEAEFGARLLVVG